MPAVPPLYKLTRGKQQRVAYTDEEGRHFRRNAGGESQREDRHQPLRAWAR